MAGSEQGLDQALFTPKCVFLSMLFGNLDDHHSFSKEDKAERTPIYESESMICILASRYQPKDVLFPRPLFLKARDVFTYV